VPEVVDAVDGRAVRNESIDQVHVPPAVLRQPVGDEEDGPDLAFRQPALVIETHAPDTLEDPFLMFHFTSSLAPSSHWERNVEIIVGKIFVSRERHLAGKEVQLPSSPIPHPHNFMVKFITS
jgi:hypothetical protein